MVQFFYLTCKLTARNNNWNTKIGKKHDVDAAFATVKIQLNFFIQFSIE